MSVLNCLAFWINVSHLFLPSTLIPHSSAGKDPMGLAGSVLYLMCLKNGEHVIQKALADAAGVTEVTIRNRTKELKNGFAKSLNL